VTEESIPELLARLEREHTPCELCSKSSQYVPHCAANHGRHHETVPCDVARLVAHARSLEAAHDALCGSMQAMSCDACAHLGFHFDSPCM
jgi:hypothetical protein